MELCTHKVVNLEDMTKQLMACSVVDVNIWQTSSFFETLLNLSSQCCVEVHNK